MDSMDAYSLLDVVWTILVGHTVIGFVWAHVPALSQLYVKTAAAYAATAMENYSVALVSEADLGDEHLRTCAELARQAVLRADFSLDYYANQRKHFANLLWVTELRWTFECLKSIERLSKSANEARKRATAEKSGAWKTERRKHAKRIPTRPSGDLAGSMGVGVFRDRIGARLEGHSQVAPLRHAEIRGNPIRLLHADIQRTRRARNLGRRIPQTDARLRRQRGSPEKGSSDGAVLALVALVAHGSPHLSQDGIHVRESQETHTFMGRETRLMKPEGATLLPFFDISKAVGIFNRS